MRRAAFLLLLGVTLVPGPAAASRGKGNQLLRITAPSSTKQVGAHPFVNVVVRFGSGEVTPDPATFRARLGGVNITPLFRPSFENGQLVGMRAALGPALLNVGRHRANRLRLEVRGRAGKRAVRDVDRLRFHAVDVADEPPVARALADGEVILGGVPTQFDALQSHDPESDDLTYLWDFGDGTTSTDPRPVHVFAPDTGDVQVRLTVGDGQLEGADGLAMLAIPKICPGCTLGVLKVDADAALEFGGVALGQSVRRTFTVRNTEPASTSDLHVLLGTTGGAFSLSTRELDLRVGESAPVEVIFAPTTAGHQSAEITLVASASNQVSVHLLTHGFGGEAPGTGPLPTTDTLFYNTLASGTFAIRPDGSRFFADNTVHFCQGGNGAGDLCVVDADCAANNGTCPSTVSCIRGARAGQPCTAPADCPGGFCPSFVTFDPVDMCGDGEGGLYLMSDEGTFTDPSPGETELAGSLMHLKFDANGNRTLAEIIGRTTAGTSQFACDQIPASAGGRLFIAEYHAVSSAGDCFREDREALVAKRKSSGDEDVLMTRIDAAEGLDPCDDYDPADDLEVTRDGRAVFVALPNGVFRVRPTTLLMTPDIDDFFQVHPDGSVLVVTSGDTGATGILRVYKISPDLAVNGAPRLSDLTPCATITVPNNRGRGASRLTTFISYAVDPSAPGSFDSTLLLSFFSNGGNSVLSPSLRVQGTYAISTPGAANSCNVLGLVNLEPLDQMAF